MWNKSKTLICLNVSICWYNVMELAPGNYNWQYHEIKNDEMEEKKLEIGSHLVDACWRNWIYHMRHVE